MSIDTSELRLLAVDLGAASEEVTARARPAIRKTLMDIEADGKIGAPVDTGALEGSISTEVDGDGLGGEVGPTVDYGHYVEGGTSRMAAQPYMGPAFDRRVPGLYQALGQIGSDIL